MELWGFESKTNLIGDAFGLLQTGGAGGTGNPPPTTPPATPTTTEVLILPVNDDNTINTASNAPASIVRNVPITQDGTTTTDEEAAILEAVRRAPTTSTSERGAILPEGTHYRATWSEGVASSGYPTDSQSVYGTAPRTDMSFTADTQPPPAPVAQGNIADIRSSAQQNYDAQLNQVRQELATSRRPDANHLDQLIHDGHSIDPADTTAFGAALNRVGTDGFLNDNVEANQRGFVRDWVAEARGREDQRQPVVVSLQRAETEAANTSDHNTHLTHAAEILSAGPHLSTQSNTTSSNTTALHTESNRDGGMTHEDAQTLIGEIRAGRTQGEGMATAQTVGAVGSTLVGLGNATANMAAASRLGTASYGLGGGFGDGFGGVGFGGGYGGGVGFGGGYGGGGIGGLDLSGTGFAIGFGGADQQGKARRINAMLNEMVAKIAHGQFTLEDLLPALTLVTLQSKMTLSRAAVYMIQTMRGKQQEMAANTERLAHMNSGQSNSSQISALNFQNQQIMMDQQVVQQSMQSVMGMVEEFTNLFKDIQRRVEAIQRAEMPRA